MFHSKLDEETKQRVMDGISEMEKSNCYLQPLHLDLA